MYIWKIALIDLKNKVKYFDAAYHQVIIDQFRGKFFERYSGIEKSSINVNHDKYPIMYHKYMALFSKEIIRLHASKVNATISFSIFIVFWCVLKFALEDQSGQLTLLQYTKFVILLVSVFYATESFTGMNDLFYILSERGHARLIVSLTFLLITLNSNAKLNFFAFLGIFLMWKISMFSRQCVAIVLIFCAFLTLVYQNRIWQLLIITMLAAIFMSSKNPREELSSHINFLKAYQQFSSRSRYFRNNDHGRKSLTFMNSFSRKNMLRIITYILYYILLVILVPSAAFRSPLFEAFLLLFVMLIFISFIVNIKKFDFLGESWRYWEYILPASASWFLVENVNNKVLTFMLLTNVLIGYGMRKIYKYDFFKIPEEAFEILESFFELKSESHIVLPLNYAAVITNRFSVKTSIIPGTYDITDHSYIEQYPLLSTEFFQEIIKQVSGVIFIKTPEFRLILEKEFAPLLTEHEIFIDNEFFFACRFND